jgi:endonuclease/exonuclease/phosphatase (EEP) superfamily protein YafD
VRVIWRKIRVLRQSKGLGCVSMEIAACTVYNCYALQDFERFLGELKTSVERCTGRVLVAGDFNAKAYMWGSSVEDRRGTALADQIAELGMVVMNQGMSPLSIEVRGAPSSRHLRIRCVGD